MTVATPERTGEREDRIRPETPTKLVAVPSDRQGAFRWWNGLRRSAVTHAWTRVRQARSAPPSDADASHIGGA